MGEGPVNGTRTGRERGLLQVGQGRRRVAAFAGRLRDAVDLDAVRADVLASVAAALEPAHLSVWLDLDRR